jgi:hypothetical protein
VSPQLKSNISAEHIKFIVRRCLSTYGRLNHVLVELIADSLSADILNIVETTEIRIHVESNKPPVGDYTALLAKQRAESRLINYHLKGI